MTVTYIYCCWCTFKVAFGQKPLSHPAELGKDIPGRLSSTASPAGGLCVCSFSVVENKHTSSPVFQNALALSPLHGGQHTHTAPWKLSETPDCAVDSTSKTQRKHWCDRRSCVLTWGVGGRTHFMSCSDVDLPCKTTSLSWFSILGTCMGNSDSIDRRAGHCSANSLTPSNRSSCSLALHLEHPVPTEEYESVDSIAGECRHREG